MVCLSGILMGALTMSLVMADVWFWRTKRVIPHVFLGGIVTVLFFTLCQRGYELVNWVMLGLVALSLLVPLFKWLYVMYDSSEDSSEDSSCPDGAVAPVVPVVPVVPTCRVRAVAPVVPTCN